MVLRGGGGPSPRQKVKKLKPMWIDGDYVLFWTAPAAKSWDDEAVKYVVYRFAKGEKVDINDPSKILTITAASAGTISIAPPGCDR